MYFFEAAARSLEISLDDVSLAVEWSEFESCHLRQRVKPTANEHGLSAQGGFRLARGWYENCTFVNCRWEGHVATDASLLNCTFRGRCLGVPGSASRTVGRTW